MSSVDTPAVSRSRGAIAVICAVCAAASAVLAARAATTAGGAALDIGRSPAVAQRVEQWIPDPSCPVEDCSILVTPNAQPSPAAPRSTAASAPSDGVMAHPSVTWDSEWRCREGSCMGTVAGSAAEWSCEDDRCAGTIGDAPARWTCSDRACRGTFGGQRSSWACDESGRCSGSISGVASRWRCDGTGCRGRLQGERVRWHCTVAGLCRGTGHPVMAATVPDPHEG